MPSRSQGHVLGGHQHLPGGRAIHAWKAAGKPEHREEGHEQRASRTAASAGKCLGNAQSWRVCITRHPTGGTQPRGVGQGMPLRCRQVYKEINRRVETGSLSCLHSRPSPLACSRGPISGHSHAWGPGTEQASWSRTSAFPLLIPAWALPPPGPGGEGAGWKLVGNTVASPTPPHQVGKIRRASKCQGVRAKEEVLVVKSLSRVRLCDPMDCSPPGSSVHGIFQARTLERVATSFSRGSAQPRD